LVEIIGVFLLYLLVKTHDKYDEKNDQ